MTANSTFHRKWNTCAPTGLHLGCLGRTWKHTHRQLHAYIHTHVHAHTHTHTHTHTLAHVHIHTCMHTCMHVCIHTSMHAYNMHAHDVTYIYIYLSTVFGKNSDGVRCIVHSESRRVIYQFPTWSSTSKCALELPPGPHAA